MAQEAYTIAEWKFHIGGKLNSQKADRASSDYSSQTWTEVDGLENLGAFGDSAEAVMLKLINRNRVLKSKGVRDAGDLTMRFAALIGPSPDAGQAAMDAAEKTNDNYAFRITAPDKGDGSGATDTMYYFVGLVTSRRLVGGDAETFQMVEYQIAINGNVAVTAATAGS